MIKYVVLFKYLFNSKIFLLFSNVLLQQSVLTAPVQLGLLDKAENILIPQILVFTDLFFQFTAETFISKL